MITLFALNLWFRVIEKYQFLYFPPTFGEQSASTNPQKQFLDPLKLNTTNSEFV